ncbi:MAG: hypothetical protein WDN01_08620 [Rhizomicrobium sp.]
MSTTTVVDEGPDHTTIVSETAEPLRFSWSAAFAGAFVAAGVTFLLVTLGSGVGLSLVTVRHATAGGTTTFLTLGAVYFLAAQAFGFAAGGHIVGRLIGPAVETSREEDFRAGTHGLVAWAIAVVATAAVVGLSALVAGTATTTSAVNGALATATANGTRGDAGQPAATSYWVDRLFRPATAQSASLAGRQYAQADTGTTTDMPPAGEPVPLSPSDTQMTPDATPVRNNGNPVFLGDGPSTAPVTPVTTVSLPASRPLGADKAEAGRILTVGMADGEQLSGEDRMRLAMLVASDTGLTAGAAERRVDDVTRRIHDGEVAAAEAARKTAAMASLWTAFALLFGAVVAVFAALSARWEDDREAGLLPGTRVSETRF